VGGDIYLFEHLRSKNEALLMVIDCTGHGVPGAFMTMLVKAIERNVISDIIKSESEVHPAEILQIFNRTIKTMLGQCNKDANSNAGFDGGVMYIDKERNILRYCASQTPMFYLENGELNMIKGDKKGVGYVSTDINYAFTEYELDYSKVESIFISTDGFLDQNGGECGFPLGKRRFAEIINENNNKPLEILKEMLLKKLEEWQGDNERSDDITVVAFRRQ